MIEEIIHEHKELYGILNILDFIIDYEEYTKIFKCTKSIDGSDFGVQFGKGLSSKKNWYFLYFNIGKYEDPLKYEKKEYHHDGTLFYFENKEDMTTYIKSVFRYDLRSEKMTTIKKTIK